MLSKFVHALNGAGRCGKSLCAALALILALGAVSDASAQTSQQKYAALRANSPFNLQAGATQVLQANLVQCGLDNTGNVCTNIFNSPTGGGGFWPAGTVNQYIFNSGLQIAGIYGKGAPVAAAGAVFAIGDTVGAYFFDARGTQPQGTPRTGIFNSLDPADIANWPADAVITDTSLFNPALVGSNSISDQDTYVRYWDGDPNKLGGGRKHPMGIEVTQRSLAFNAPAGAENTLFLIYKFKNVTNEPDFQLPNEAKFGVSLPDAGWTIDSIYAAVGMDADVSANGAGTNFSTPILPFNIGVAYHATFQAPEFNFNARADLYAPPFFAGPGFVGAKYLRSPVDPATGQQVGLTLFTNNTNGGAFPDPLGEKQLWRYLSGNITTSKSDPPCNIANPKVTHLCYLAQDPADTRFIEASGPFSLAPGQEAVIVVAYTHGAPLKAGGYTQGQTLRPGIPSRTPGTSATDTIRTIERVAGMIAVPPAAIRADGSIDESKVTIQPRSLLANAEIAQQIFNNKFLLPRPPEPPSFALVPGSNQVTVVWQPTNTEKVGDPYFKIASDPTSALYDPDYRQFDVAGYRIYKATGLSGAFTPVIQFDKTGDTFSDFTGEFDPNFVPEECPATQTVQDCYAAFVAAAGGTYPVQVPLTGDVVQFPAGGRVRNAVTGSILTAKADTVHGLTDGGIPFAFVDHDVKNGITYRYAVTAFDINSLKSGVASIESPKQPQQIVPRSAPTNEVLASFTSTIQGDNSVALNTGAALPTIDPDKGTFSGPQPPTDGISTAFSPLVQQLLPAFKLTASIDSVLPLNADDFPAGDCPKGSSLQGTCWRAFLTFNRNGIKTSSVADGYTGVLSQDVFGASGDANLTEFPLGAAVVPADPAAAAKFGLPPGFTGFNATVDGSFLSSVWYSSHEGQLNRRTGGCNVAAPPFPTACLQRMHGGSRWFDGANETVADPTTFIRVGHVTGIDSIWAPINHTPQNPTTGQFGGSTCMQSIGYQFGFLSRAADIKTTWGAAGALSTVRDVVHNVNLRFSAQPQAGTYGFVNVDANGNGVIDYQDFFFLKELGELQNDVLGFCSFPVTKTISLEPTAKLMPISLSGADPVSATSAGTGFAMYIDGEFFIFKASALPAANVAWTLRTYAGQVLTNAVNSLDANGYTFAPKAPRNPLIPGLNVVFESTAATGVAGVTDLSKVHTVPDPYFIRSQYELGPNNKRLLFQNLPAQALVRIFSVNGTLVRVLEHNDPQGGGQLEWDLRSRTNQFVASGVYFYVVESADGQKKVGRMTVLNFAR